MPEPTRFLELAKDFESPPFLKWLGGKRWLIEHGLRVPALNDQARYHEPFLGAGSLFFALRPARATLSDVNAELTVTFRQVAKNVERVIEGLLSLPNDPGTYARVRDSQPTTQLDRAIRLIYLNRTAYGGMYRVNRQGKFNVPYGHYVDRRVCQAEVLRNAAAALQGATTATRPFGTVTRHAKPGDLVYFDPPYESLGTSEVFSRYTSTIFTWEMHKKLARTARELADRGVHVLISNTAHPEVIDLYGDFHVSIVKRATRLSRDRLRRGITEEAVFSTYASPVSE